MNAERVASVDNRAHLLTYEGKTSARMAPAPPKQKGTKGDDHAHCRLYVAIGVMWPCGCISCRIKAEPALVAT